jgi:hypothetical protein
MVGLFEKLDRLFKARNSIVRLAKKPVRTGHVCIKLSEHERGRIATYYLHPELEIL